MPKIVHPVPTTKLFTCTQNPQNALDSQYKLQIILLFIQIGIFSLFYSNIERIVRSENCKEFLSAILLFRYSICGRWPNEFFIAASKSCRCKSSRHPFSSNTEWKICIYCLSFEVRTVQARYYCECSSIFGSWTFSLFLERSKIQFRIITFTKSAVYYRSTFDLSIFIFEFFEFTVQIRVVYDQ